MNRPNGLALSPDEKTLYVDDTAGGLVRKFPVRPDGSLGPPTIFVPATGVGDGMAMDDATARTSLYRVTLKVPGLP